MNIKNTFSTDIAKKIFGNKANATSFLIEYQKINNLDLPFRTVARGKCAGDRLLDLDTKELWNSIVLHWDYDIAKQIIRDQFVQTEKYRSGKESYDIMKILLDEWEKLKLSKIAWPFSQGDFDGFVQRVNSEKTSGFEKDEKVKQASVKYRRIKEINTVRNDFIETLIFEKNQNILPTLNHNRGVDFFINGISFDQKVANSPTSEFQKHYGPKWKDFALNNPHKVAEYLYMYQDEGRFGADSRLLVVYLDDDISIQNIAKTIEESDLENPLDVSFEFRHNKGKPTENIKMYKVKCFVVLLSN